MATFEVKAKNKVEIHKKPRVYFTCHPKDFDKHFEKICDDILETHDCAIYYTKNMAEFIPEAERESDIARSNLLVIPVTYQLLNTPSRAMGEDVPYALKNKIPVLPLMMEAQLDSIYAKPDKFDKLQYLNPYSTDQTEISYKEKLKKYLGSVLIGDEMAERIRAAFDAYIFLSYRKKDRRYANNLMRLIHSNPECRNIAIWFDEFLTPGESFKDNIEKMLDDCSLFALLVTPQLLEKVIDENGEERDNYVVSVELPLARKKREEKGTDIFAVEMEHTDKAALSAIQVEEYVNCGDSAFRTRLLNSIARIAAEPGTTPEHNFLIGLAYRDGIDVEVDRQNALTLITSAADTGLHEAMLELSDMYRSGNGVMVNYHESLTWMKRLTDEQTARYGEKDQTTLRYMHLLVDCYINVGELYNAWELGKKSYHLHCKMLGEEDSRTLDTLSQLVIVCNAAGRHREALELAEKLHDLCSRTLEEDHIDTVRSMYLLARTYSSAGKHNDALTQQKKVYALQSQLLGEEDAATLTTMGDMAYTYCNLGQYEQAIKKNEAVYAIQRRKLGEEDQHTLITQSNLAYNYFCQGNYDASLSLNNRCYQISSRALGEQHPHTINTLNNLAAVYNGMGEFDLALTLYQKVYAIRREVLGERHPDTLRTRNNVADLYSKFGQYAKALSIHEEVYALRREALGEAHPDTLGSMNNLAYVYGNLDCPEKALELNLQAYALRSQTLGKEHPDTLTTLNNQAHLYSEQGNHQKAIEIEKEVYELSCEILGEEHPSTLTALNSLGVFYQNIEDYENALELGKKAHTLRCKVLGEDHPDTLNALYNLSAVYLCLKKPEQAWQAGEKAYRLSVRKQGPDHPATAMYRNALSALYLAAGEFEKAQKLLVEAQSFQKNDASKSGKQTKSDRSRNKKKKK